MRTLAVNSAAEPNREQSNLARVPYKYIQAKSRNRRLQSPDVDVGEETELKLRVPRASLAKIRRSEAIGSKHDDLSAAMPVIDGTF